MFTQPKATLLDSHHVWHKHAAFTFMPVPTQRFACTGTDPGHNRCLHLGMQVPSQRPALPSPLMIAQMRWCLSDQISQCASFLCS